MSVKTPRPERIYRLQHYFPKVKEIVTSFTTVATSRVLRGKLNTQLDIKKGLIGVQSDCQMARF